MKRIWLIVVGVCCLICSIWGKSVVVAVESYQSATLSGDIWSTTMDANYYNDTKSGGRIGAGKTATMTLLDLPAGTIDGVTIWVHSNVNSGAGDVKLKIGEESMEVATGDYKDWPGRDGYTTDFESIKIYDQSISIIDGTSVTLIIEGEKNSLYINQMSIDYTPAPAEPHNVTLSWVDKSFKRNEQLLKELNANEGVQLCAVPDSCKSIIDNECTWNFVGWSEDSNPTERTHVYGSIDRYYPQRDVTLYAVYSDDGWDISQDTAITSGEYVMVLGGAYNNLFAMYGSWNENKIQLKSIEVEDANDGLYHYHVSAIPKNWRYTIDVQDDSIAIWHEASQTWIGYELPPKDRKSSSYKSYWKCIKTAHGSICLCAYPYRDVYCVLDGNFESIPYVTLSHELLRTDCVFWVLFPVGNVPTESRVNLTAFAEKTGEDDVKDTCVQITKIWKNGQIYIYKENHLYTILGIKL